MPKLTKKNPEYKRRPETDSAYFWLKGKKIYLPGKYNSPESIAAYNAEMAKLSLARSTGTESEPIPSGKERKIVRDTPTVSILVAKFLQWGDGYYQKNGMPTGTNDDYDYASRKLVELYGHYNVTQLTQEEMENVLCAMIDADLSRQHINDRLSRIKRIFKWGVMKKLILQSTADEILCVESLHKGKSIRKGQAAPREAPKPRSVKDEDVKKTLPFLPQVVADMVRIQRATGMRPGEIFRMKWEDIDTTDFPWLYLPPEHKTDHHDIEKAVPFTRYCQKVLERYKDTPQDEIIFSPRRTVREQAELRSQKRKTPVQPSQVKRKEKAKCPEDRVGEKYTRHSYRRAVQRAAEKAGVEKWTPYMLRRAHANASDIKYGKEAARDLLGHTNTKTTEIYLRKTREKFKKLFDTKPKAKRRRKKHPK